MPEVFPPRHSFDQGATGSAKFAQPPCLQEESRSPICGAKVSYPAPGELVVSVDARPPLLLRQAVRSAAIDNQGAIDTSDLPSFCHPAPHLPILVPDLIWIEQPDILQHASANHHRGGVADRIVDGELPPGAAGPWQGGLPEPAPAGLRLPPRSLAGGQADVGMVGQKAHLKLRLLRKPDVVAIKEGD